ncbi:hypothetical protein ACISSW_18920, partial [Escherichia coli]
FQKKRVNNEGLKKISFGVKFFLKKKKPHTENFAVAGSFVRRSTAPRWGNGLTAKISKPPFPADDLQTRNCPCQPDRYTAVSADY